MAVERVIDLGFNGCFFPVRIGDTLRFKVRLEDEENTPVSLDSASATMTIQDLADDADEEDSLTLGDGLEITDEDSGEINVKIPASTTDLWEGRKRWMLRVTLINDDVYTLCGGMLKLSTQLETPEENEEQIVLRSGSTIVVRAPGPIDLEDLDNKIDAWIAENVDTGTRFLVEAIVSGEAVALSPGATTTSPVTPFALRLPSDTPAVLILTGTDLNPSIAVETVSDIIGLTVLPSARLLVTGTTYAKLTFVGTDDHPNFALE